MIDLPYEIVFFTGHVQGVGFRYTALEVAREFEVAGFVSNLPDGRVQLEVEGESKEIDAYVMALEERMHGYIRNCERIRRRRVAEFRGFTIR